MENISISEEFFYLLKNICTKTGVTYNEEQIEATIIEAFEEYANIHQSNIEVIKGIRDALKETEMRLGKVNSRLDNVVNETEKFLYFVSTTLDTKGSPSLTHFLRDGINELIRHRISEFSQNLKSISGGYSEEF